jgi:hypothetical protein
MPDDSDEDALARDMIEVHGVEASGVARANARTAALTGAVASAKRWIRVLDVIQRRSIEQSFREDYVSSTSCSGEDLNDDFPRIRPRPRL